MAETLSGIINQPIADIIGMVSRSAAWQTWTGTASEAAALGYVFAYAVEDSEKTSPCCVVERSEQFGQGGIAEGGAGTYAFDGGIVLLFDATPTTYTDRRTELRDSLVWICNQVGAVLAELLAETDYTNIVNWRVMDGPNRTPPKADDRVWIAIELEIGK